MAKHVRLPDMRGDEMVFHKNGRPALVLALRYHNKDVLKFSDSIVKPDQMPELQSGLLFKLA